jgi:hypothetical protein
MHETLGGSVGILPRGVCAHGISCIPSIQICSKIYGITILVFEIKEGKNAQKVKNILTIIYHYLLDGDSNGRSLHAWGHTPPENLC